MNERIKELWTQTVHNYGHGGEEICVQQFAELIVRECISAAVSAQHGQTFGVDRRVHWNNGIAEAVDMIVERFGVK
jgi:hypothetical protein